jgi:imidazolonepropionase-like amidohydrolase
MRALNERREPDDGAIFRADFTRALVESFSARKAAALFAAFRRNDTWQTPTLAALPIRAAVSGGRKDLNEDDARYGRRLVRKLSELVAAMDHAGVRIMAGTDLPPDGSTLNEELELLVEAGLAPMEALQAATRNPAEFLGRLDTLGTVEKGKIADLVLLDADPLADIRNTRKVRAVLFGGKWVATAHAPENSR